MLHVRTKNATLKWWIGHEKPHINANEVCEIQADGDELNHIIGMFAESIPYPANKRVVRWYGDTAKTIFYAL